VLAAPSPPLRRLLAAGVGLGLVGAITAGLLPVRGDVSVATPALVLVIPGIVAGLLGGRLAALVTATVAALVLDLVFIEPYGTLDVHLVDDVVALVSFLAVALVVAGLLSLAVERQRLAEHHAAEVTALERTGDAQRAMLRSVSHDLRTPLAAIRAVTTDLRDGSAAYDDGTRRELLDVVIDEAERLDRLVANLLGLSRVEAGALAPELQAVDLEELLADRVRRLSRLLEDVEVTVHVPDVLPLVDADYTLLDQVVTNLLENAARHAPPGSAIRIDVAEVGAGGRTVEVAVTDQGPGVAPDDQGGRDWVFEPFRSGERGHTRGIGLAISRAIVEAHGGRITVGDAGHLGGGAGGRGARFAFTLPVHWARAEPGGEA
jgi:two-component system sensor histidine kinase KdpD